jgi:hypothetical protein
VLRRGLLGLGALAVVAAVVLALAPLRHQGVSGNAVRPAYEQFGWYAYSPMPPHATVSELRAAGVQLSYAPGSRHAVTQRRWTAGGLGGVGILLIAGGLLVQRRDS